MKYRFLVKSPDGKEDIVELEKESIIIGSSTAANIQIESESVSALHCMVRVNKDGNFNVMDMGSKTGVFVNGEKVKEKTLDKGDIIKVGDFEIKPLFEESVSSQPEKEIKKDKPKPPLKNTSKKEIKNKRRIPADSLNMYVSPKKLEEDKADESNKVPDVIVRWLGGMIGEMAIIGKKTEITIGTTEQNDFVFPEEYLKADRFQLVGGDGSSHTVNVPEGWELLHFIDGKKSSGEAKK
ncbi:MAG: FHA domain-containing protein, partial [Deltaproteobacteria bacterium]|nr:FHA domain-containing protein [Deltaproteobacteria bacterium]